MLREAVVVQTAHPRLTVARQAVDDIGSGHICREVVTSAKA